MTTDDIGLSYQVWGSVTAAGVPEAKRMARQRGSRSSATVRMVRSCTERERLSDSSPRSRGAAPGFPAGKFAGAKHVQEVLLVAALVGLGTAIHLPRLRRTGGRALIRALAS